MCRGMICAPAVVVALAAALTMGARAAAAADVGAGGDGGVRTFDLGEIDEAPVDLFSPTPLAFAPTPPEPQDRPVVVPLPAAAGPGLAGLATLAVMRFGRRAYRR